MKKENIKELIITILLALFFAWFIALWLTEGVTYSGETKQQINDAQTQRQINIDSQKKH